MNRAIFFIVVKNEMITREIGFSSKLLWVTKKYLKYMHFDKMWNAVFYLYNIISVCYAGL